MHVGPLVPICDTKGSQVLGDRAAIQRNLATSVILAPSLDGGSLRADRIWPAPSAVRPMIAVWVRRTALSAAGCTQTAIMGHA